MKLEQQQQAQDLYFQTDLNKSQIAETLGISRRSLHYWIRQNEWERTRTNGEHIPSFLAENCYALIGGLMDEILSDERADKPVTPQEANTIYKLTLTIGKLKNRGTINEHMELFGWFLDDLDSKDAKLAAAIQPYISSYITTRTAESTNRYREYITTPSTKSPKQSPKEADLDLVDQFIWAHQDLKENTKEGTQPAELNTSLSSGEGRGEASRVGGPAQPPTPTIASGAPLPRTNAKTPPPSPVPIAIGTAGVGGPKKKFAATLREQFRAKHQQRQQQKTAA